MITTKKERELEKDATKRGTSKRTLDYLRGQRQKKRQELKRTNSGRK